MSNYKVGKWSDEVIHVNELLWELNVPHTLKYVDNQWELVNATANTIYHDVSLFKLIQKVLGIMTVAGMLNATEDELEALLLARKDDVNNERF